ncbi:hypothetical protein F4679DRAFT_589228 [Xylaria curta]|nr:hypothetical protein F4679DRAFT_589228 [Xylaria curta]
MASTIKEKISKVADHIPGFRHRRNEMVEAPKPTDYLGHRYADPAVLRTALQEMGFKDKDITIFATERSGLDVHLPRQLTDKEKDIIFSKFEAAKKQTPPVGDDEDD